MVHFSTCCVGPWADPTIPVKSDNVACPVVINDLSFTDVVMFHYHGWE